LHGLRPEWAGRSFTYRARQWRLIGLNLRSRKRPAFVENDRGKQYLFAADVIIAAMGGLTSPPEGAL